MYIYELVRKLKKNLPRCDTYYLPVSSMYVPIKIHQKHMNQDRLEIGLHSRSHVIASAEVLDSRSTLDLYANIHNLVTYFLPQFFFSLIEF